MRLLRAVLILSALLIAACSGGGAGGGPDPDPTPTPTPQAGDDAGPWALDLSRGEALYADLCQSCHQRNGTGGYGPALDNDLSCRTCAEFGTLWPHIDAEMPLRNPETCDAECARNIAAWIINGFSTVPSCSVDFRYDSIAPDRFSASLRIVNFRGEDVPEWRLGLRFTDDERLVAAEGLRFGQEDGEVLIEPLPGDTRIADGETREFSLSGEHRGSPLQPSDLRLEAPPCFTAPSAARLRARG